MDFDTFSIYDTKINYHNNTDRETQGNWLYLRRKFKHYGYFYQILHRLEREGFSLEQDPEVAERHKRIAKHYWYGRRRDLEFVARKYPNGFEIEFFQNVVHENSHDGRYDFDKLKKMPYLIRLQYTKYMRVVVDTLKSLVDVKDITKPVAKSAEEKILIDLSRDFHLLPDKDFDLRRLDGTKPGIGYGYGNYEYPFEDRDGKPLLNGDVKYFRQYRSGRLMRGRIYYRANQQFWVIVNEHDIELANYKDLFDPTPEDFAKRRKAPDRTPKEYKERRTAIDDTKSKELIAELRRRGLKVKCS